MCSVSSYCKMYMLWKKILHWFIFCFYVKITKNDNYFILSWVKLNRFVKYQRKYLFFWDVALQIDATNHFSFLMFISKGIICILDGILKSLSLLEGICNLTNAIKPTLFSLISSIYGLIILIYELTINWEKINLTLLLLYTKYQYFHLLFYLNHQTYS